MLHKTPFLLRRDWWLSWYLLLVILAGCSLDGNRNKELTTGIWRGTLNIQGRTLPFNFEIIQTEPKNYLVNFKNGPESIVIDEVRILGDSVFITMDIFDSVIKAQISKNKLRGTWSKNYTPGYVIPFHAELGAEHRFAPAGPPTIDISGKWMVNFSDDSLTSVGVFQQDSSRLTGTFLTSKGDYRYLEGVISADSMYLSTFDGEHAFLFEGHASDENHMDGSFRSGLAWMETWTAVRDPSAALVDPDSLTFLKPGYDKLSFSFPDLNGRTVSLDDPKYHQKVVIVQLFGTWCPNCLDETKFLSQWYDYHKDLGVEIIGLAYERMDDFTYAKRRLNKMIGKFDVKYDFLIAGTSDMSQAAQTLPMLNHIMSFPTTIFIDHNGIIRRIYTGFSGPGTGEYYQQFVDEFNLFTEKLLVERLTDSTLVAP